MMAAESASRLERHYRRATLELVLRIREMAVTEGLQAVLKEYQGSVSVEWLCDVVFYRRFKTIICESALCEIQPEVPANDRRREKQPRSAMVSAGPVRAFGLSVRKKRTRGEI